MDSKNIIEVTKTLLGSLEPSSDSYIDDERFDNQDKAIDLVYTLINVLARNSEYRDRTEFSVRKIGEKAYEALTELYSTIGNYL